MNSVVERFGSMSNYEITSTALNFTLCVVSLVFAFFVYKGNFSLIGNIYGRRVSTNAFIFFVVLIALLNAVSGGLNFV